jgi:hypothetical protein
MTKLLEAIAWLAHLPARRAWRATRSLMRVGVPPRGRAHERSAASKGVNQRRYVFEPLAERQRADLNHREPLMKVSANSPVHAVAQVTVSLMR